MAEMPEKPTVIGLTFIIAAMFITIGILWWAIDRRNSAPPCTSGISSVNFPGDKPHVKWFPKGCRHE